MFAHYYSIGSVIFQKIHLLTRVSTFPLFRSAIKAFQNMKRDIANSDISTVNPSIPLIVETDTPDCGRAASLRQSDRPVAFISRTLSPSERRHSAIEQDTYTIVEAL